MQKKDLNSNKKQEDDEIVSIGTPLGHFSVNPDIFKQSVFEWASDVLNEDEEEKDRD